MALFGALSTGKSGLDTSGADLSVIGNNIANVSTVGFKGSRLEFADLLSANAGGEIGNIGLGARVGAVRTLFTQGAIESTGRALDLAIQGEGFFVVRQGQADLFTRAGNFQESATGVITDLLGHPLQGTPLNADGSNAGGVTDVDLAGLSSEAKASTTTTLVANLQSDAAIPAPFDEVNPDFQSAFSAQSNYFTNVQIFDSLGKSHNLTLFFSRTDANTWQVHAGVDAGDTGGTPGNLQLLDLNGGAAGMAATISFDSSGKVASTDPATISGAVTFSGAAAQTITLDLSGLTQFASPSATGFVNQNGFGAGGLTSIDVDSKGILSATFDNGQTRPLFQLAIARFTSEEGLTPIGNQLYQQSAESGPPAIATAQTSGDGSVVSSSLEQSNVSIASEFIDLISAQRAFQANSRVITASDTLLDDLINIIH